MWKQAQYLQMKENSVLSLQKHRSQGVRTKKKKRIKELGPDRPYFVCLCPLPPLIFFSTSRHCIWLLYTFYIVFIVWISYCETDLPVKKFNHWLFNVYICFFVPTTKLVFNKPENFVLILVGKNNKIIVIRLWSFLKKNCNIIFLPYRTHL